jgi:glycyl-tRNA synthetase beta chain
VLAEVTQRVVPALHFPKRMRWGSGEHEFVRPVHGVVALHGSASLEARVPLTLFGVEATGATVGHRVSSPGAIELLGRKGLAGYGKALAGAGVVLDPAERRNLIEQRAAALAAEVGCEPRRDQGLLDELAELVEYPGVVLGTIDRRFLELPEEVLVTTLRHHQKALALNEGERLAPYFLTVCDRPDDPEGLVRQGNEWVVGARLADAEFFFAHDRQQPLLERAAGLGRVAFHAKLGSYGAKSECVRELAKHVVGRAELPLDVAVVERTVTLVKADLVTSMVGEFPELQGVVGGIYARLDGEPEAVWQAVYDQYTPAGLEGWVPRGTLGAVVGLADRLDTLAGMFAVGEAPTGSKDPLGLRRAALAVVKICAEEPLSVDLQELAGFAYETRSGRLNGAPDGSLESLLGFLKERIRYYLTAAAGVATEVAEAVLEAHWGVVPDDLARATALQAVRQEAVFSDLAVVFKRVRNMLSRERVGSLDEVSLVEPAERALAATLGAVETVVDEAVAAGDHTRALRELARLAAPLDRFFTEVLVLCDDARLRAVRLALLARVERVFLGLADLSRLAGQTSG